MAIGLQLSPIGQRAIGHEWLTYGAHVTKEDIAKIVGDLVTIAKVAMPPNLFLEDPRVKKAKALLVSLGRPSSSARPPNIGTDADLEALVGPIVDIRPVDATQMVLDWDLVDAVLEAREHGLPPDDNETLNFIIREWLTTNGYLDPGPEESS